MKFYTTLSLQMPQHGTRYSLPHHPRGRSSGYGDPGTSLDRLQLCTGSLKKNAAHDYVSEDTVKPFKQMIQQSGAKFIAVLGAEEEDIPLIGACVKNCFILWYNKSDAERQLHVVPLGWYPLIKDIYFPGESIQFDLDLIAYIDGKSYEFLEQCKLCPKILERTLGMCSPFQTGCTRALPPFLSISNTLIHSEHALFHLYESDDEREWLSLKTFKPTVKYPWIFDLEWFEAHPMDLKAMPGLRKDMKEASNTKAFERPCLATLSSNPTTFEDMQAERSANSVLAARTRRFTSSLCVGCLAKDHTDNTKVYGGCFSRGGKRCSGPHYASDLQVWADSAEPWMVHACLLPSFDARKHGLWTNSRTDSFDCAGPYIERGALAAESTGVRSVRVCKSLRSSFEWDSLPYEVVCESVKQSPVSSWDELTSNPLYAFKDGVPDHIKAAAWLLNDRKLETCVTAHSSFGGKHRSRISGVTIFAGTIRLVYKNGRAQGGRQTAACLTDLVYMDGVDATTSGMSEDREQENKLLKLFCIEYKVKQPVTFVRKMLAAHPEWLSGTVPSRRKIRTLFNKQDRLERGIVLVRKSRPERRQLKLNFEETVNAVSGSNS